MAREWSNMKLDADIQDGVALRVKLRALNLSGQQSKPEDFTELAGRACRPETTVPHCQRIGAESPLPPSAGDCEEHADSVEHCTAGEQSNNGSVEDHLTYPEPVNTDQGSVELVPSFESSIGDPESRSSGDQPRLDKLASSSSEGHSPGASLSISSSDKSAMDVDIESGRNVPILHSPVAEVSNFKGTLDDLKTQPGFHFVPVSVLQEFLKQIITFTPDIGIFHMTDGVLAPHYEDEVWHYREETEYWVKEKIHGSKDNKYGVYICCDNKKNKTFVLKKMKTPLKCPLHGIAFVTLHCEQFMPKIYAVYKEPDCVSIFQEHIKGGTLKACNLGLGQVRKLLETMLLAFEFLHVRDLVHYDVKLDNLMVRDQNDPSSLVIIDFESSKHPDFLNFHTGGYTLIYLPPWHDQILCLKSYDQKLKSSDMWGIACIIIFFLSSSDRHDLRKLGLGEVWIQHMKKIRDNCKDKCEECCHTCKENFKQHLRDHGSNILPTHVPRQHNDDNWRALYETLKYLTSTSDIHEKHVRVGLRILNRCQIQSSDVPDFDISGRN